MDKSYVERHESNRLRLYGAFGVRLVLVSLEFTSPGNPICPSNNALNINLYLGDLGRYKDHFRALFDTHITIIIELYGVGMRFGIGFGV